MNDSIQHLLIDKIKETLQLAKIAVESDKKGDYANAHLKYKETITNLENFINNILEEKQKEIINDLIKKYTTRIEILEQSLPYLTGLTKISSSVAIHISNNNLINRISFQEEHPTGSLPEPPPACTMYRPYWLMRILLKTIQTGGYLTPQIYIPKSLWFQSGIKFSEINTKIVSCSAINESLIKLKILNINNENESILLKELENFNNQLGKIQNSLSKFLPYIPEYKQSDGDSYSKDKSFLKKFGGAFTSVLRGKEKLDDVSSYVSLLTDIFENCQFLDKWLQYSQQHQPNSPISTQLKRISDFFCNVLCNFVIRDIDTLIRKYLKRYKENFSKINNK